MPQFNRRRFLGSLGLTAAALACPGAMFSSAFGAPRRARKPNVILILSDDVGLDDIGCYGGKFKTPNIDALAMGGTRFEYCYSAPLCGPSRAELLTGRYPFRTGMENNQVGNVLKPANETMIPTILKTAGYTSVSVGKWQQLPLQPGDWGFDEYFRFYGGGVYRKGLPARGTDGEKAMAGGNAKAQDKTITVVNGQTKPIAETDYAPDLMHGFLTDFITRHKDGPFFAYYPMSHMHGKLVPTPDHPNTTGPKNIYADNIAYMDKLVGQLVAHLDKLGLREDTLIIFTGDNGTAVGPARANTLDGESINGAKGSLKEGGSRVPLIANWKGTTPAGRINHDLTDFSDFLPTLANLAGATLPTVKPLDGHSFLPQVRGEVGTPREWVYVELNRNRYVRDARWKLTGTGELYDMSKAPIREILVPATTTDTVPTAARTRLQAILDKLVDPTAPLAAGNAAPGKKAGKANRKAGKAGAGKGNKAQKRANKTARKARRQPAA